MTDALGQLKAMNNSYAVIHFTMDGIITKANENFLSVMEYRLDEVVGKHHSIFVEQDYAQSQAYKDFWKQLQDGISAPAQYKRISKTGKEVWIEACYNPIPDINGRPFKVVKIAVDLTPRKNENKKFADDFEQKVSSVLERLSVSASTVQKTATTLSSTSEETSSQSNAVASATEELSASVNEIASQVTNAASVIEMAVAEAENSQELVSGLVEATSKIGEVTKLISEIAEQTNLLAL